jgi:hypothetical protein
MHAGGWAAEAFAGTLQVEHVERGVKDYLRNVSHARTFVMISALPSDGDDWLVRSVLALQVDHLVRGKKHDLAATPVSPFRNQERIPQLRDNDRPAILGGHCNLLRGTGVQRQAIVRRNRPRHTRCATS